MYLAGVGGGCGVVTFKKLFTVSIFVNTVATHQSFF